MASFVQRALMYLGLKDIDDEEIYDGRGRGRPRARHEPGAPEHLSRAGAPARPAVPTVRPSSREDGRESQTPVARGAVVRPLVTQRHSKPQVVAPARFSDAQEIGDMVKANIAGHRQPPGEREGPGQAHDRLLLGPHLRGRRLDGKGRRVGVPAHAVERRGVGRGAPAPARERIVPVLKPASARAGGGPSERGAER